MQYSIIDISEQPQLLPNNRLVKSYRVSVSMGDKGSFTINIPESEFTPAEVKKRVEERVKTFAAVLNGEG